MALRTKDLQAVLSYVVRSVLERRRFGRSSAVPRNFGPGSSLTRRFPQAWAALAATAVVVVAFDVEALRAHERPLIDRRTCLAEPSAHTLALDRSLRGDALYRFVYGTLLGFGAHPRSGFPHVDVGPVCTLGWKDPVAAIKIGDGVFLVTFDGARVVHVEGVRKPAR